MHLHNHRRAIDTPGQIPDLLLPHIVHLVQAPTTSPALKTPSETGLRRTHSLSVFASSSSSCRYTRYPGLRQNRCPFFMRQLPSVPKNAISLNHRYLKTFTNSCGEPYFLGRSSGLLPIASW